MHQSIYEKKKNKPAKEKSLTDLLWRIEQYYYSVLKIKLK